MSDDRAYRIIVAYDADKQNFAARIPELEVESRAATRAEAIAEAEIQIEQRIAGSLAENRPLPRPVDVAPAGGTLTVKIADALHRDLLHHARSNGMSAEEYAGQLIARAVGALDGGRWRDRDRDQPSHRPQQAPRDPDAQPQQRDDRNRDDRGGRRDDRGGGGGGNNRGGPRGRQREGYRPELDDKANFLEYLRGLEKGGPGGGGGRGRR
jgi:predicted RNase H-like HicB family nuclease